MAVAAIMAVVLVSASHAPSYAGSGDPASNFLKKKKDNATPATTNWSGSGNSGSGKATTESGIVSDQSISPFLSADSVSLMQASLAKYEQIVAAGGWPNVPSGKYKAGGSNKAIAVLNKRLAVEGYLAEGEADDAFSAATEQALRRFQRNHGLAVTGALDTATLKALNVSASQRLATLKANVPRIAEYSKDLGERYIVVNVPAVQIETVAGGRVFARHNAIVGRPSRPTPVVMTPLTMIRFSPYWNAPPSIVEKDILPRMLSGGASKVMAQMNMKIFKGVGGPEVDPDKINWRRVRVDDYHFRQEPGGENAMATAKIEFNSPHGIYLHDTPEPELFEYGQRFFSSGCIRVQKVAIFIDWILQGQDGIGQSRIAELAESKERLDVAIANAPQLRVTYLTAWPTREGVAAFRPDIYELDGSGFVTGQPLPVGQKIDGKRYVLKPIPRSAAAVDADEASGFGSLFGRSRNPDKQDSIFVSDGGGDDSLINTTAKAKKKAEAGKKARAKSSKSGGQTYSASRNPDKDVGAGQAAAAKPDPRKKTADKTNSKKKLASATKTGDKTKKTAKKEQAAAEAKNATSTETAAAAAKKPGAAKKPENCKAGKDGKLPSGCKTAAAKKPPAKPAESAAN